MVAGLRFFLKGFPFLMIGVVGGIYRRGSADEGLR